MAKFKVYVAKPGGWYDEGCICLKLTASWGEPPQAIYWGTRTSQTQQEVEAGHTNPPVWPLGKKYQRSEICYDSDFEFRAEWDTKELEKE